MPPLSVRVSAASATTRNVPVEPGGRMTIAPMLLALLRVVIFLAGLASPFVVALLAG